MSNDSFFKTLMADEALGPVVIKPKAPTPVADWTFQISTGRLLDRSGQLVADGLWAGHGEGYNNPDWQAMKGQGPLPVGLYRMGPLEDGIKLGPDSMRLTRVSGVSYGRGGFWIHGASALHPLTSSDGCLIAPHPLRLRMSRESGELRLLAVTV